MATRQTDPQQIFAAAVQAHEQGRLAQAEAGYRAVLRQFPRAIEPNHFLGLLRHQQGRHREALKLVRKAHELAPREATILYNLGVIQQASMQAEEAIASYQEALRLNPAHAMCHNNIGTALESLARFDEACEHYDEALRIDPDCFEALNNRGNYLKGKGLITEAMSCFQRACEIRPDFVDALVNWAGAHQQRGDIEQAHTLLDKAISLAPDDAKARSNFLMNLNYTWWLDKHEVLALHRRHGPRAQPASVPAPVHRTGRLRIGYVSADLRTHSVAYFMRALLKHHDATQFEIHVYSNCRAEDRTSEQLRSLCPHWHNISRMDDHEALQQIRKHGIDILVDLSGHTADNRQGLFALRAAPVQVTYLGYPNTTGNAAMDYRLVDTWTDPDPSEDEHHCERLMRLDSGFLCYQPPDEAPEILPTTEPEDDTIRLACFNNPAKLSTPLLNCWSRLLAALPSARLALKARAFADPQSRHHLLQRFARLGLDPRRIDLLPHTPDTRSHLACYQAVDIALDTFPYNGTTTTCEALWMGVPVITLAGDRHAARTGVSLLHNAGLDEFIALDEESYIAKVVALANDGEQRRHLRQTLRARLRAARLMDGKAVTQAVEQHYRRMAGRDGGIQPEE